MHTSKILKKSIVILLLICVVLTGASQISFAISADAVPDDAVIIGFIDSGIAPYNMDQTHILEGKNYVFESSDTVDRIGHGTKTAGMVLGSSDGSVLGTCPDAYVVPLVVVDKYPSGLTSNGGTDALVSAIYDAVDLFGCSVINISLCTNKDSNELNEAVDYACSKGVILVCAAGNYGDSETTCYPAHYDNVITVGSSAGNEIADFSLTQDTDFYCEGKSVPVVSYKENGKTSPDSGTSYSCASVAGICASLLAQDPSLTLDGMRALLRSRCIEGTSILRSTSETSARDFRDTTGHWAEGAIEYCAAKGIFHGSSDGLFMPDEKMTRAMFVTVLWNMAGNPETEYKAGFSDVSEDAWYSEAVDWAYENGLVRGISSDAFAPGCNISREQVCVLLDHYAAFAGHVLKKDITVYFSDKESISSWAEASVVSCASAGIINGYPDQRFGPGGDATRAECCAILRNYCSLPEN